jgi:hypothetical protein
MTTQELLGYSRVSPNSVFNKPHPDYSPKTQARGATWIENAVLVSAHKGGDYWWYGQPDPWTDPAAHRSGCDFNEGNPDACFLHRGPNLPAGTRDLCSSNKGYHALMDPDGSGGRQYTAMLQFYDANELAQVAAGRRTPDSVLPYASLEGPGELWDDNCAEPGDLAYDAASKKLYWVERNGTQPLIHVYSIGASETGNAASRPPCWEIFSQAEIPSG